MASPGLQRSILDGTEEAIENYERHLYNIEWPREEIPYQLMHFELDLRRRVMRQLLSMLEE